MYVGGEALACWGIRNLSKTIVDNLDGHDSKSLRNYVSVRGKFGLIYKRLNFSLFYERDLAPICDQKNIYESGLYDFEAFRKSIYERGRVGLSLSYLFNL